MQVYPLIHLKQTSPKFYLSGLASLNIPSPSGSGDWHFQSVFSENGYTRGFYAGIGAEVNTISLYESNGIEECGQVLKNLGIVFDGDKAYAATHPRAIADLIADSLLRDKQASFIVLDDWLNDSQDLLQLNLLLDKLSNNLTAAQLRLLESWKNRESQRYLKDL
ncbi:MAG TPA: hypothetical protein DCE77_00690 [Methylophaga sp.]|nr:hypothetical protein [Methylophaga sp.]MAP28332.1 hypothetical protein [Methylophaga sp.]HAD30066.1 hypothetical protein [Methylophaga sp.]HBX60513.1 hypothetical protein [Methylophaga sp.]